MKHRQIGIGRIGVLNADGHAIGVDIGATSVRAAVLSPGRLDGRPSVTVHGLGHVDLPRGAVVNGVVTDQAAVTRALKQLWDSTEFECRSVILGITNQQVVVRDLTMPNLPHDKLAKALPFQAREIIAIPVEQALLDFTPLGDVDESAETIPGLLIATPRAPIIAAVQAVERAKLHVARVDLSSFAALRAIADEARSVEAVVDIGAHITNIVIHSHGVPKVVRAIVRAGHELTERLADRVGYEVGVAEQAKRDVGLTGSEHEVVSALREGLRPFIAEIRSSINYFSTTNAGAQIERVSLTGGGSALRGLARELTDELGVPAIVIPATQHIRNRLASKRAQQPGSELSATAVSVGLAMGAAA